MLAIPYEIAVIAKQALGLEKNFVPISKAELDEMDKQNNREKRVDAILNGEKLAKTGFKIPQVQQRIKEAILKTVI